MTTAKAAFILVCLMAALRLSATADSIQLRNGRHLNGKYIGGSTTLIGFMTAQSVEYFQIADVTALMFGDTGGPAFNNPQSTSPASNAQPSCSVAPGSFALPYPTRSGDNQPTVKIGVVSWYLD